MLTCSEVFEGVSFVGRVRHWREKRYNGNRIDIGRLEKIELERIRISLITKLT